VKLGRSLPHPANSVFRNSPKLDRVVLPIEFADGRASVETNLATRAEALRNLGQGGAIGVFPGGTVSTSAGQALLGAARSRAEMAPYRGDQKALMDFLRARTYALSPRMLDSRASGFEFEAKHRANNRRAEGDVGRDFR